MGLFHSPRIVTDGLTLALDAGNIKSYPYSGTTWTDLGGKGNNGTLTNGPTFSLDNGGAFEFDGTNDYVDISGSITVSAATFLAWIRLDDLSQTSYTGIVFSRNPSGSISGMNFYAATENIGYHWNDASNTYSWDSGLTIPNQEWCMVALTVSSSVATAYLFRSSGMTSATNSVSHGSTTLDAIKVGADVPTNRYLDGRISVAMVYNKALTASEVAQNYNAIKSRYSSVWSLPDPSLYDFTSAFFTVSRALTDSPTSDEHRFGPTESEVRAWLEGSSNGGGSHSWANTYVDCPQDGYQRWTIPKTGKYRITAKGGGAGFTDTPDDYMRGVKVIADFNLTRGEKLILAAGQGVPDFDGDHCNGGGGASWVMSGNDYATAIPLIVANGAGGDTSDGNAKGQANTTLGSSITVTPTSGEGGGSAVTGKQTTPINSTATAGRGSQNGIRPNSGGWLSDGADAGETGVGGHGFRNNLIGGTRSNSTAGYGGFGGGSGGEDESGSAGGGFTGAHGEDGNTTTGHGSSFVNDDNQGNVSVALAQATTTFQNTDYTSEDQYQGWIKIEFIS